MHETITCDYKTNTEASKKRIKISCGECNEGNQDLKDTVCRSSIINIFLNEYNISKIVLSGPIEKQYTEESITLLQKMNKLVKEIHNISKRKTPTEKDKNDSFKENLSKNDTDICQGCDENPTEIFSILEQRLKNDYGEFLKELLLSIENKADIENKEERCIECREKTHEDLLHLLNNTIPVSDYILRTGFKIIRDEDNKDVSPIKFYEGVNFSMLNKGIETILDNNKYIRPVFSSSWLQKKPPQKKELVDEYNVGDSSIEHYQLTDEMEGLYHISLEDYNLSEDEARLIQKSIDELSERYPENISMDDRTETRKYIESVGKDILLKKMNDEAISFIEDEVKLHSKLDKLASILAKNTAGLGVLEDILEDDKVQDIYIDAPAPSNPVYITTGSLAKEEMRGTCFTNLILGKDEIDSILSRIRMESGRPFSESEPILEYDMDEFNIRSTVIGKPLSPEGTALALRRHSREPWTLLKLIANKTITPTAAGLFSFLIDGRSTILVAGSRGAGKTSLLSALLLEFPVSQRMITIEDTLELPAEKMQNLGYKVQNILVGSSASSNKGYEKSPEEALRVSLRLGESAIIMGEVRGEEAKTLYEAMRAGTAGSSVLGTFHANSPSSVFERAVYDIGIPAKSFLATDIVSVVDLKRPRGVQKPVRKLVEISELDKESQEEGEFRDLMNYGSEKGDIMETDILKYSSQVIGRIARSWDMTFEEAYKNIKTRAKYREIIVETAKEQNMPDILNANWVKKSNTTFWRLLEKEQNKEGKVSYENIIDEWKEWFFRRIKYA